MKPLFCCTVLHSVGPPCTLRCPLPSIAASPSVCTPQCVGGGGVLPALLVGSHRSLSEALSALSKADPTTPAFDLTVLEVADVLADHSKVSES